MPTNFSYGARANLSCPEVVHFNGSPSLRVNGKIIYTKPQTKTTKYNQIEPFLKNVTQETDTDTKIAMNQPDLHATEKSAAQIVNTADSGLMTIEDEITSDSKVLSEPEDDVVPLMSGQAEVCPVRDMDFSSAESDDVWMLRSQDPTTFSDSDVKSQGYTIEDSSLFDSSLFDGICPSTDKNHLLVVSADVEPVPEPDVPVITVTTPDLINDIPSEPNCSSLPTLNRSVSDNTSDKAPQPETPDFRHSHSKSEADLKKKTEKPSEEPAPFMQRLSFKKLFSRKRFSKPESSDGEESGFSSRSRYSFAGFSRLFASKPAQDSFLRSQSVDNQHGSSEKTKVEQAKARSDSKLRHSKEIEVTGSTAKRKLSVGRQFAYERISWSDLSKLHKGSNVEVDIPQDLDDGSDEPTMLGGMSIEHLDKVHKVRGRFTEDAKRKLSKERNCKSAHGNLEGFTVPTSHAPDPAAPQLLQRSMSDPCLLSRQKSQDVGQGNCLPKRRWTKARKSRRQMKGKGLVCFVDFPDPPAETDEAKSDEMSPEGQNQPVDHDLIDLKQESASEAHSSGTTSDTDEFSTCSSNPKSDSQFSSACSSLLRHSRSTPDLPWTYPWVYPEEFNPSDNSKRSSFSANDLGSIVPDPNIAFKVTEPLPSSRFEDLESYVGSQDIYRVVKRRKKLGAGRRVRFASPLHRESFRDSIVYKTVDADGVRETFI